MPKHTSGKMSTYDDGSEKNRLQNGSERQTFVCDHLRTYNHETILQGWQVRLHLGR